MNIYSNFQKMRDYFVDVSGEASGRRPKAHVVFRYYNQYHDGTQDEIDALSFDKPILSVFQNGPLVYVAMDFRYRDDMDLRMAWDLITRYKNPLNSVSYLQEELDSGYYMNGDEKRMVYFPVLEVIISPIGKEGEYEMHGLNPLMFGLGPASPLSEQVSVLQLTFDGACFEILNNLETLDYSALRAEAEQEIEASQRH